MPSIDKMMLRQLIADNEARQAMERIRSTEQALKDEGLMQEVTLLLSQWQACRQEFAVGRSTPDAHRAENQRINDALLHLIRELPEEELQLGLPPLPDSIQRPQIPFTGLHWFTWADARVFFGRQEDIRALYGLVTAGERLILLYGQSGVGKSSLLHAGLLPRLEYRWPDIKDSYHRRDPARGLPAMLEELLQGGRQEERILVLDQVEEIYTNPHPALPDEEKQLAALLAKARREFPRLQFILGFRKEYKAEVEDLLGQLDPVGHFLKPLSRQGVLEAITGVANTPYLQRRYHLAIEAGLPEVIADDILRDTASNIAPLLQILLRKMWDAACEAQQDGEVCFTQALYAPHRQSSLDALLDSQLEELGRPFPEAVASGLALDVLMGYTTPRATAGELADEELQRRYPHIPHILELKAALQRLFLLTNPAGKDRPAARLAHDALAPIIRKKFSDSDKPGQRAWQVLEPKLNDLKKGLVPTLIAPDDLHVVLAGQNGTRRAPQLEELIEASRKDAENKEQERYEKNLYIFNTFADGGIELIYTLEHEKALGKLKAGVAMDFDPEIKRQKLTAPIEELLFFFAEAGRRLHLATEAASLLLELNPSPELRSILQQCLEQGWNDRHQFTLLVQALSSYAVLKKRYYPDMAPVPGGRFDMGTPEGDPDFQNDETLHPVELGPYHIAATPVTFYQYALYCESVDDNIAGRSPGWGKFGDHPLVNISWYEALEYCNWLSEQLLGEGKACYAIEKKTGSDENNEVDNDFLKWKVECKDRGPTYRLPTEAEWEFAARGGGASGRTHYAGSDMLEEVGWYWKNSAHNRKPLDGDWRESIPLILANCGTHPVGQKKPVKLPGGHELFDLSGNVYEWCWDWYASDYYEECRQQGLIPNPTGAEKSSSGRVVRGGGWYVVAGYCRAACRGRGLPDFRDDGLGFRLAFVP